MTAFFLPGTSPGTGVEVAYRGLRERSRILAGCPATSRRIFRLSCRLDGRDCELEVGRPLRQGGHVVVAILDHGRDEAFTVHTAAATGETGVPIRVRRPVYSVTEFR